MTSPRNVFSATQTPDEGGSGVGAPLLDSAAVCALLGVQRNALGDLRAAQAVAGHQNIQTTVSVYGKDADEARKRAAAAMDDVMSDVSARRGGA